MYALHQDVLAASGVEHATFLNLSRSTPLSAQCRILNHLVVARSNLLRIFEVREEPSPLPTFAEADARARNAPSKLGTEAVEGEVEMDQEGDGYVNMAQVRVSTMLDS